MLPTPRGLGDIPKEALHHDDLRVNIQWQRFEIGFTDIEAPSSHGTTVQTFGKTFEK
jgi:hypothetical protein